MAGTKAGYHHGDLCAALIDAGLQLTRTGGPEALTIREATRRAGVSPNAAYRHFADREALLSAVATAIQDRMAARMFPSVNRRGSAQTRALNQLRAVGLGYIEFALDEPGWFAVAFFGGSASLDGGEAKLGPPHESSGSASLDGGEAKLGPPHKSGGSASLDGGEAKLGPPHESGGSASLDGGEAKLGPPHKSSGSDLSALGDDRVPPPFRALVDALDAMTDAGVLQPNRRAGAEWPCWSAVHGFAELALHGPLRGTSRRELEALARRTVDDVISGLVH
ncbi:TetR/AcrR family transcriptional regulator [Mycolicibacter sinensis]|uniref:TetR family transcriptional regulator n=1 Tax=Mycolicibacter sinensis (strain JDM601) TaxID=875328 RepID=A0A1A2NS27_MYCSD|nr:TetR/AcrR family transcriptional regulator [Mycolicibacter sinensis]OBH17891.1 TetR family transcriptional regulator [Mycolicibacter sinensis]OBI26179.1 TetR family transcriptional regulator [Mycolicibacter sinensis]